MNIETEQHDREAIRAHIDGLFQAYVRKDREAIRNGHTRDWCGFQVESARLVRGIDDYMKAADASLKVIQDKRYEIHEIETQIYGDIAVVFYLATVWGLGADNAERTFRLRSVDIYRRESTGWNQSGSNISLLPEERAG